MIKVTVSYPTLESSVAAGRALIEQTKTDYNLTGDIQAVQHSAGPYKLQLMGPVKMQVTCLVRPPAKGVARPIQIV